MDLTNTIKWIRGMALKSKYLFSFVIFICMMLFFPPILHAAANGNNKETCPGKQIANLHGTITTASKSYSNEQINNYKTYYYYFTPQVAGTFDVSVRSNRYSYDLTVLDGCDGTVLGSQTNNHYNKSVDGIAVDANQTIVVSVHRRYSSTMTYEIDFRFTVNSGFRDFTLRKSLYIPGNMVTVGNTIFVLPQDEIDSGNYLDYDCNQYTNGPYVIDADGYNSDYTLCQYKADGQRASTMATVTLPDPAHSTLMWAGLYWQSIVPNTENVVGHTIKLKHNASSYVTVPYTTLDYMDGAGKEGYISYSAFADVTDILQNHGWLDGNYTVADIPTTTTNIPSLGQYGAWTLVIAYRNDDEKFRNISIFDGWRRLQGFGDPSDAEQTVHISGFYTPRDGDIHSAVSVFTAEGDKNIQGDYLYGKDANDGDRWKALTYTSGQTFDSSIQPPGLFARTPSPTNNMGIDIQTFKVGINGYNFLKNRQSETDFKFATKTTGSARDTFFPSMIAFNTELFAPRLCYDYRYRQNGRNFTEENNGSRSPSIRGHLWSNAPINVSLFLRNKENSDFIIEDLSIDVRDINTSQTTYIDGSLKVSTPTHTQPHTVTPADSNESDIFGIPIGTLRGDEYTYIYYDLQPQSGITEVDMPMNIYMDYNITFPINGNGDTLTIPFHKQKLNEDIPICSTDNFKYNPVYRTFNVEEKGLGKYNIFTQVAKRADNFVVKAYDATHTDTPKTVSTVVAVELIDAGGFHETEAACQEPSNSISPRVWVTFDNSDTTDFTRSTIQDALDSAHPKISDRLLHKNNPISQPGDLYAIARQNTAFRVSYPIIGEDTGIVQLKDGTCQGQQQPPCYEVTNFPDLSQVDVGNGPGNCVQDVDGNPHNTDKIPEYCGNAGAGGLDRHELAVCMECVYGSNIRYICSRDNFAIRPDAFKVSLTDDNTSTLNANFANNKNITGSVNLVAGYPYRFDINATSYMDEKSVSGYVQRFSSGNPLKRAFMKWAPSSISQTQANANCNAPTDQNMTFYLVAGTNTNPNPLNMWGDRHDKLSDVGEYQFQIFDKDWTRFDWDPNLMRHHDEHGTHFIHSNQADCAINSNATPPVPSTNHSYRAGCDISSIHSSGQNGNYYAIPVRSYPYEYNLSSLAFSIGPSPRSSNETFVYIDSPPQLNTEDTDMSYNISGIYRAVGYPDPTTGITQLNNFVKGCYADNTDMKFTISYMNHDFNATVSPPTLTPYLSYSLKEVNSSNEIIRPANSGNDFEVNASGYIANATQLMIPQNKNYFTKDMRGAVSIDLGFNFDRNISMPLNPRFIRFKDLNITYRTQPTTLYVRGINNHKIYGDIKRDENVTFLYGRAKPFKFLYDDVTENNITTPINIVVYSDDTTLLNDGNFRLSNEYDWYINTQHRQNINNYDGKVSIASPSNQVTINGISQPTPYSVGFSNGQDQPPVTIGYTGTARPKIVDINLTSGTDRWLIYNPDKEEPPKPFYRVRFIGIGSWTGYGKTGHVVGDDINNKKSKRLEW